MIGKISEIRKNSSEKASELTLYQYPFRYRLRVEGNVSKSFRRILLLTALKKLHELFREPKEAVIAHDDSPTMNNYYDEFREISFREAHTIDGREAQKGLMLKLRRHQANLTLKQLALLANLNSAHLCQIEKGKVKPHVATLARIEQALLECKRT